MKQSKPAVRKRPVTRIPNPLPTDELCRRIGRLDPSGDIAGKVAADARSTLGHKSQRIVELESALWELHDAACDVAVSELTERQRELKRRLLSAIDMTRALLGYPRPLGGAPTGKPTVQP